MRNPGRIINAILQAGSRNALLLLDEIDKMGADYRGIIEEDVCNNLYVDWNDFDQLQQVFEKNRGQIAAVCQAGYSLQYPPSPTISADLPTYTSHQTLEALPVPCAAE